MVKMADFMLSIFYLYFLIWKKKDRERIKLVQNNKVGYHVLRGVNLKYSKNFQNKQMCHSMYASIWCGGMQRTQSEHPARCLHIRLNTLKSFKVGFSRQGLYVYPWLSCKTS